MLILHLVRFRSGVSGCLRGYWSPLWNDALCGCQQVLGEVSNTFLVGNLLSGLFLFGAFGSSLREGALFLVTSFLGAAGPKALARVGIFAYTLYSIIPKRKRPERGFPL